MSATLPRAFLLSRAVVPSVSVALLLALRVPGQEARSAPVATAIETAKSPAASPISITSAEISLDLVVRTNHHQPVVNLEPSQITVYDNGTPVRLTSLRLVDANTGPQHLVALVFDPLDANGAKEARRMAERILGAIPARGYKFAVFEESGRLRLLQAWTEDRRLVSAAVAQATAAMPMQPSGEITPAEKALIASLHSDDLSFSATDRMEAKLILDALEQSQRILEERHGYPSLAALQALAVSDRVVSGRKFIFYFSAGGSFNSDARDILHTIVGLANRAGVTIGVVNASFYDPRTNSALEASEASSILGEVSPGGGVSAAGSAAGAGAFTPGAISNSVHSYDIAGFEFGGIGGGQSPLVALADGTGGIYLSGSGSGKRELRALHEDLSSWYQTSWVPPVQNYDGQFRKIDIWSSRRHLEIRGPTGYFAMPPSGLSEVRPFEMPLLNMLAQPRLPTDVAFQTGVLHLGALPDGNAAELVVQVPVSELQIHEDANTHISSADAAIVAVIKDSKGRVLQDFGQEFPLHETPEMFRVDSGQTLTLERQFSASPGVYTLETAVLDRIGNKSGGQRTTFRVDAPAQGPSLSDVTLVESIEPAEEDNQSYFEPMRYGDGEIVPSLDPYLPGETRSVSFFFLVHPQAGSQNQPTLRMQIIRNGQLLREMPMRMEKVAGTGAAVPCLARIEAQQFPPGGYQVKAVLSQEGRTASSGVSFRVEGSIAASDAPIATLTAVDAGSGANVRVVADAATANSQFVISSPRDPLPVPAQAVTRAAIEGARQRALGWSDTLENFYCLEVTNHFVDATGDGDWRLKGSLVELMKYVTHGESRTIVQLNGEPPDSEPDRLRFFHSTGEFGAMFHVVFDPSAKAAFTWKRSALIDGQPVQVFAFQVARANSTFNLTDREGHTRPVGFRGLLYLDPATNSVRRISMDADDIPEKLLIRACSLSVDYAWISMGNHDFLLPVRGAVSLQETGMRPVLNRFEFRNYRRFGSQVRMLSREEMQALAQP